MTPEDVSKAADRLMQIVEDCRVANNEQPFTEEQEAETLKKVLEAIIREVSRIVIKDAVEEIFACLSQQKPTDMN